MLRIEGFISFIFKIFWVDLDHLRGESCKLELLLRKVKDHIHMTECFI